MNKQPRKPNQRPPQNKKGTGIPSKFSPNKGVASVGRQLFGDKETVRLNRYISNAGIASRREADELIAKGDVKVNGKVITEMGYQVSKRDKVTYLDKPVSIEKPVYVLLNKPKNYITTTNDPKNRKVVMDLVKNACDERIYPVGRLDRATMGLLLLTNDGELADRLMHPSTNVRKTYWAFLDRAMEERDFLQMKEGLSLEDGPIKPDALSIASDDGAVIEITLHSGRNRIVRRMFEHLNYQVNRLDRIRFAGLTKKDLPRGKWRYLNENEIIRLKHFKLG